MNRNETRIALVVAALGNPCLTNLIQQDRVDPYHKPKMAATAALEMVHEAMTYLESEYAFQEEDVLIGYVAPTSAGEVTEPTDLPPHLNPQHVDYNPFADE
jgi:hypothetical protein